MSPATLRDDAYYTRYFFGKYYSRYAQRLGLRSPRWFALLAFSIFAAYRETLRPPLHAAAIRFLARRARLANIRPGEVRKR